MTENIETNSIMWTGGELNPRPWDPKGSPACKAGVRTAELPAHDADLAAVPSYSLPAWKGIIAYSRAQADGGPVAQLG